MVGFTVPLYAALSVTPEIFTSGFVWSTQNSPTLYASDLFPAISVALIENSYTPSCLNVIVAVYTSSCFFQPETVGNFTFLLFAPLTFPFTFTLFASKFFSAIRIVAVGALA